MVVPDEVKPTKRDNTRYCEFHRDHGRRTDDCIQLRKEIEYLIRRGYLRCFVASEGQTNEARTRRKVKSFNTGGGGGAHNTNSQRMFSEETEGARGSERESRKVIIIIGRLTTTKP